MNASDLTVVLSEVVFSWVLSSVELVHADVVLLRDSEQVTSIREFNFSHTLP
jgi:hypothetical protein